MLTLESIFLEINGPSGVKVEALEEEPSLDQRLDSLNVVKEELQDIIGRVKGAQEKLLDLLGQDQVDAEEVNRVLPRFESLKSSYQTMISHMEQHRVPEYLPEMFQGYTDAYTYLFELIDDLEFRVSDQPDLDEFLKNWK